MELVRHAEIGFHSTHNVLVQCRIEFNSLKERALPPATQSEWIATTADRHDLPLSVRSDEHPYAGAWDR